MTTKEQLEQLRVDLPNVFKDLPNPPGEEWMVIDLEDFELEAPNATDLPVSNLNEVSKSDETPFYTPDYLQNGAQTRLPGGFPGGFSNRYSSPLPPPDALAFYLPIHYFLPQKSELPQWYGIYLIAEGVESLSQYIYDHAQGKLSPSEAHLVAQQFLFKHEAFHCSVESFAFRLEVTHHRALYIDGFQKFYDENNGKPEESFATAKGLAECIERFEGEKREAAFDALWRYIEQLPDAYSEALRFFDRIGRKLLDDVFDPALTDFLEANHQMALKRKARPSTIWNGFPYALHPLIRINSHVSYIVNKNYTLAKRARLGEKYFRSRDVVGQLKSAGCEPCRPGKGSHAVWRNTRTNKTFPIPHKKGDFPIGTLGQILKQAGIEMSPNDFMTFDFKTAERA